LVSGYFLKDEIMRRITLLAVGLFLALLAAPAFGQGVLIIIDSPHPVAMPRPWPIRPTPTPPAISYKLKELAYQAKVTDQIAQVQVSQTFVNNGSQQIQAQFCFPLPYDGAIDRMTYMVDGKEYEAKLLEKKKAREIYEGYVRKNQDPALLEWVGTGMFQTSVFPIPPGAERKVSLKYTQLLRKSGNLTDFMVPLSTAKFTSSPVEKVSFEVNVEAASDIKSIYSPSHAIEVKRPDNKHASVKFEGKEVVPTADFRLLFDTNEGKLGASVLSYRPSGDDEGYFLLLASPEIKSEKAERQAKTVILALDRSGSMSGKKIEQAREALKFVLNNLREGDTFNIVAYDSSVESFKPELQKYDEETRKSAIGFVEGIYAGGSTNIDGAMTTALGMLQDQERPNFVLFFSDGIPTAGETHELKIVANAEQNNKHRARVVNFGVGYDVNSRLLDRLARELNGTTEYVRPDENIEASVSKLYGRMSSPVMTNVAVKIEVDAASSESGSSVNRVYPKEVYDLFAGEQLVQVGRYKKSGDAKVTISGKVGSEEKKHDFPAKLVEKSGDQSFAFVEKLWALRRVGEIIDELDLKGQNEELTKELVELATKHGILTPYTSFLADETSTVRELADVGRNTTLARRSLERLSEAGGQAGFAQRAEKKVLQEASGPSTSSFDLYAENGEARPADGRGSSRIAGRVASAAPGSRARSFSAIAGSGPAAADPTAVGASASPQPLASNSYRDIDTDGVVVVDAVRNVGNETFYKRGKIWVAANATEVDPEKDQAKIKKIKRFDDAYFALVRDNTKSENEMLARQGEGEQLLVKLRGQVYQIE
jgi:Ca-activated chloride channel family protein